MRTRCWTIGQGSATAIRLAIMAREFGGVVRADCGTVCSEPVAETRFAGRGAIRDEEIGHEAGYFVGCEDDVTEEHADDAREGERQPGRRVQHAAPAAQRAFDEGDQLVEGEGLRA